MSTSFENGSLVTTQAIHKAMGGEFVYLCYPQKNFSKTDIEYLFKQAHAEVLRIEKNYTEFHDSILNSVNRSAGVKPVKIDEEMFHLLNESIAYSKKTNGIFDITFATLTIAIREAKKENRQLSETEKDELRNLINYNNIELNRDQSTVFFKNPKTRISFGGIGKGYAVDRAFSFLESKGLVNFSVNGSGDLRVHSSSDAPRPWKLGIRNPFAKNPSQAAGVVQLANGALVSSGTYVQGQHIISSEREQTLNLVSMTLIADTTMMADVYATSLMLMNPSEAMLFLNKEDLIGIGIDQSGKTHLSTRAIKQFGLSSNR